MTFYLCQTHKQAISHGIAQSVTDLTVQVMTDYYGTDPPQFTSLPAGSSLVSIVLESNDTSTRRAFGLSSTISFDNALQVSSRVTP